MLCFFLARLAGPAMRGGVGAVLLGPVVADGLGAHDPSLHRTSAPTRRRYIPRLVFPAKPFRPGTWSRRMTPVRCHRPCWSPRSRCWPPARYAGPGATPRVCRVYGAAHGRRPARRGDRSAPGYRPRPPRPARRPTRSAPDTRTRPSGSTRADPPSAAPRRCADPAADAVCAAQRPPRWAPPPPGRGRRANANRSAGGRMPSD